MNSDTLATILGLQLELSTIIGRNFTHFCKDTLEPTQGKRLFCRRFVCHWILRTGCSGVSSQTALWQVKRLLQALCMPEENASRRADMFQQFRVYLDMAAVMPEISTVVSAQMCAAGVSKKGRTARAMPRSKPGRIQQQDSPRRCPWLLKFILTGGERLDMFQAEALLAAFAFCAVIADEGYDSDP